MSSEKSILKYSPARLLVDEPSTSTTSNASGTFHKASLSDTNIVKRREHYLPPINANSRGEEELGDIQDILNCILPPKQWEKEEKFWIQPVSTTPATRFDVIKLQDQIDALLEERKAKEFGICPVRRDIYNQYFDELLRQVTVNCAERGLLLMRVRDELRLSLATYQSLYESAIAFGLRKALNAEQKKSDAEIKCEQLEKDNLELTKKVRELKLELDDSARIHEEEKQIIEERYKEGSEKLKLANQQLKVRCRLLRGSCDHPSVVRVESTGSSVSLSSSCPRSQGSVFLCVFLELVPCAIVMLAVTLCVMILLSKLG